MKTLPLFSLLLLVLIATSKAVTPSGWIDNYAKAVEQAKTENKRVLLDFTGSDWCGFCMALDKEVFSTSKFKSWSEKNVVLVKVDFPRKTPISPEVKSQNSDLQTKFSIHGFPTIIILDTDGNELTRRSGYKPNSGPDAYIALLEAGLKK